MEQFSLDSVINNMYDSRVAFIKSKNIELEREHFTENSTSIPMGDLLFGTSYDDHFESFKVVLKDANAVKAEQIFMLLQEIFLFSYGHDLMFKSKLEADLYMAAPIRDLVYPQLEQAVKAKYNDLSVYQQHPNLKDNLKGIDYLVYMHLELQSLLWFLYCHDFQFPRGWERLCPDTHAQIIEILNKSGMTIGHFLHALVDYKIQIMEEIMGSMEDKALRSEYLQKVQELKDAKHAETQEFTHTHLPITYFLDHTLMDFLQAPRPSAIYQGEDPGEGPNFFGGRK